LVPGALGTKLALPLVEEFAFCPCRKLR
jgi:hypothetical protein